MVKEKVEKTAFLWRIDDKEKLSSVKDINYESFEIQQYLLTERLTTQQKKLLFQLRKKKVPLFNNRKFEHKDGDILCPFCRKETDCEGHIIKCEYLVGDLKQVIREKCEISDIFSHDINKQITITHVFEAAYSRRKTLLQNMKLIKC